MSLHVRLLMPLNMYVYTTSIRITTERKNIHRRDIFDRQEINTTVVQQSLRATQLIEIGHSSLIIPVHYQIKQICLNC